MVGIIEPDGIYARLDFTEADLAHIDADETTFTACSFHNARLFDARLTGARFEECDFTGSRMAGANVFGASFIACKLMGLDVTDIQNLAGATFDQCQFDLANFRNLDIRKMTFNRCSFREADFSGADLQSVRFRSCDLTRMGVQNARFGKTDVRGSELAGWNAKTVDLSGLIVDPQQAFQLIAELGISIDVEDE